VRVSALLTCWNAAWCIERALDSVFAQTRPADEVLVSDDGSTDDTVARIEARYGDRVRVLRLPHRGLTPSRRAAIEASTGDWFALLDADDVWLPEKLERQIALAGRHPQARWLVSDAAYVTETEVLRASWLSAYFTPVTERAGDLLPLLVERSFALPSGCLIERAAYDAVGGFDVAIPYSQDYDLFLKLAARFHGAVGAEPLLRYYASPGQLSRRMEERYRDDLALMRAVAAGKLRDDPAIRRAGARRAAETAYRLGLLLLRAGRFDEARPLLREAAAGDTPLSWRLTALAGTALPAAVLRRVMRSHRAGGPSAGAGAAGG